MSRKRRLLYVMTATVIGVVLGVGTTVVLAGQPSTVVAVGTGADIDRVKTKAAEGFFQVIDTTPSDGPESAELPGARHRLILTEETLVVARFQALAPCFGGPAGFCSIEIHVLDNNAGDAFVAAMEPNLNVIWDEAAETDNLEVGGIERSITLSPGDYDFQVVVFAQENTGDTNFQVEDWHFTVERIV